MNRYCRHVAMLLFAAVACTTRAAEPNVFAFVGEKLKVDAFEPDACAGRSRSPEQVCIMLDLAFHAEYRVTQPVYGHYTGDIIRFDAYDHYGTPAFARYRHALLFVSLTDDGRWVHQKYQYFPVYETAEGGWAGCGSADRFEAPQFQGPSTAQPVAFKAPVVESLEGLEPQQIARWYPAPDWHIAGDLAVCLRGSPVSELFEAKKRGTLKARGLFE